MFIDGFRYDAHPMGMLVGHGRRAVDLLSRRQEHPGSASRAACRRAGSSASCRRWRRSRTATRSACPTSIPDNDLSYTGNFLSMLFKMTELQVQAEPGAGAGARRALHPARRPRAELLDQRDALGGQLAGGPVLGGGGRGRRALRAAARRRQRGGDPHADGDRLEGPRPRLHQEVQGGRGPADGLRPPRLQELRPARQDHQADCLRGVRGHRARTR